jgi:hypothetical protein
MFGNRVLRKIFGSTWVAVTGDWRIPRNEELHGLYCPHIITMLIKSWRMRWAGLVARTREGKNVYLLLVGNTERRRGLGRPRNRCSDSIGPQKHWM